MKDENGKAGIFILMILIAIAAVVIIGLAQGSEESAPISSPAPGAAKTPSSATPSTPAPVSTTPTVMETPTKAPKDIIPASISGFDLVNKMDQYTGTGFPGEVSASAAFFKPSKGSQFENKLSVLTFYVGLFQDNASAASIASKLGTSVLQLEINGKKANLVYDNRAGRATIFIQAGKMVIFCYTAPISGATSFDEAAMKSAVTTAFVAIKF